MIFNPCDDLEITPAMFADADVHFKNAFKSVHPSHSVFFSENWPITTMNFHDYIEKHKKFYKTPIRYAIQYDSNAFVESRDCVAARVHITTKIPNEPAESVEVMQYKADKIHRLWEVTYPDWRNIKALKS